MEAIRYVTEVSFAIFWTVLTLWVLLLIKRNDAREKEIRINTRRDATNDATNAWLGMCEVYEEKLAELRKENRRLQNALESCEKEIELWEKIGKSVKLSSVRKSNESNS